MPRFFAERAPLLVLLAILLLAGTGSGDVLAQTTAPEGDPVYDPSLYEVLEYRMIGPHRGGRVTAVTGVPDDEDTFLMGSTGGGVWETTDAGETWTPLSDGQLGAGSIGAVEVAPSDPNVLYVGTGSACPRGNVSIGDGVYRSTDGGDTWTHVGLEEAGLIGRIVVDPTNPDRVYAAVLGNIFGPNPERGVYRSTDGGETWEKVLFVSDSTGAVDLAMNPENPREIYATTWRAERKPWTLVDGGREGGVYKTTDGGDSWRKLGGGLPDGSQGPVGRSGVTVSPADPDRVWALVTANGERGGVYRSDDRGQSWTRVNGARTLRQRGWYYSHIHADPQDKNTVYVLNADAHRSVDGGESFETIPMPHGDVHDLWIDPEEPDRMVVGNDGGAQVSQNGAETWTTMRNQPTAEFYRVEVDDQVPYRVYGAQQDNSTISIPNWAPGGLAPDQLWYAVGGGESGHIAVHPENPDIVYAGNYIGRIDRYNRETGRSQNVIAYPQLGDGVPPKDLTYRFQWNAPIEISPHDPDVLYHAAQYVLRSTDEGRTWERISPDLTTNNEAQQFLPGGPIQHDDTGVEVYNTVFALTPSPHEEGTIWAGSDDGLVHLTRDDGESWTDVTPDAMPTGGTVNVIEASPHEPGRAYLAVYKYRQADFRPYIFRTDDYGASWTRIADGTRGLPADHFVRVVREDPERPGLLYAGTEFGMYVSFDDGAHWQSLQLNLPTTPITDLKVHRSDLVVATQGRSFWVLDDLTPLRQLTGAVAAAEAHLFAPRDPRQFNVRAFRGDRAPTPPPEGAVLHYALAETPDTTVALEIRDDEGALVRRYTTTPTTEAEGDLPVDAGLNRFVWDLTYPGPDVVDDAVMSLSTTGDFPAPPGRYRARLEVGDWSAEQSFEVRMDPRVDDVTEEDLRARFTLARKTRDRLTEVHDAIRTLRAVRTQAADAVDRAADAGVAPAAADTIRARAERIRRASTDLETTLMQTKNESPQDPINFPPQLDNQWAYLYTHIIGAYARPTEGTYERFDDLAARTEPLLARVEALLKEDVAALNAALRSADVLAVQPPRE